MSEDSKGAPEQHIQGTKEGKQKRQSGNPDARGVPECPPGSAEERLTEKGREGKREEQGQRRGSQGNRTHDTSMKSTPVAGTSETDGAGAKASDKGGKSASATGSTASPAKNKEPKQFGKRKMAKDAAAKSGSGAGRATGAIPKKHFISNWKKRNHLQKRPGNGGQPFQKDSCHTDATKKKSLQKYSPALNFHEVKQLKKKDAHEIVERLNESISSLQRILSPQNDRHSADFTFEMVHVLAKACDAPSSEHLNNILASMKNSVFLKESIGFSLEAGHSDRETTGKLDRKLFEDLIKLFSTYLRRLPGSFADVPIEVLERVLEQSEFEGKGDVFIRLENLKGERSNAIKMDRESKKTLKRRIVSHGQPPNDFRDIPVCPSTSEVTTNEKPFLRKNITKGRYDDVEHYLDVQFRLLREDFLSPLREGIAEVVQKVPRKQCHERIKIYKNVRILGREHTKRGITFKVQFDASHFTMTRWETSKRLIYGSFLCLSRDNFQSMLFATVANRDPKELSKGQFDVQFLENQDIAGVEKQHGVYVMAESRAYYESCRHVLLGLKQMNEDSLPFVKYLVECNPDVDPPQYLEREDDEEPVCYDLCHIMSRGKERKVPILMPDAWPSTEDTCLDQSQLEAFKTSVTKEFSIIQGPPGTGKTYVGAKIVQCLLHNREVWDPRHQSPMLMVCYTNHALDQFLEKVRAFLRDGIVRVGGRSKSELLKYSNLRFLLGRMSSRQREVEEHLRKTVSGIRWAKRTLSSLGTGIRPFTDLEYSMDERHVDQFLHGVQAYNASDICKAFELWLCNQEARLSQATAKATTRKQGPSEDGRPKAETRVEVMIATSVNRNNEDGTRDLSDQPQSGNHGQSSANTRDASAKTFQLPAQKQNGDEQENTPSTECKNWPGEMSSRSGQERCDVSASGGNENRQSDGISNNHGDMNVEPDPGHSGDSAPHQEQCPNASEETIRIEFESELLQDQRCLAGEEDDFQPLEATTTETDIEGDICAHPEYGSEVDGSSTPVQDSQDDPLKNDNEAIHIPPASQENNDATLQEVKAFPPSDGGAHQGTFHSSSPNVDVWSGTTREESKRTADPRNVPKIEVTPEDLRKVRAQLHNETAMSKEDASDVCDIWTLSAKNRRKLYLFWLGRYREYCEKEIQRGENAYKLHCKDIEEAKSEEEERVLRSATVIGMTTTGAARYHDVLRRIKPKIVVIEEAAEVLEAHIITSLTRDTQHVIMIGDHQQLRPKATVYDLARRYNLEISLFERMVLNKMDCKVLTTQHRMRPEIAELTKRIYENKIHDHETVLKFRDVRGLQENLFFLNHHYPETRVEGLESYSNEHEASFAVSLCRYFLQQGYRHEKITVLTTYTAQLLALQRLMPKRTFDGVRVSVVDNFQGEENDIIILSLVRSGQEGIGFLSESNRICVALSRARKGFYCIGNFDHLSKKCELWREICDDVRSKKKMGEALILECKRHKRFQDAKTARDFEKCPGGGCGEICRVRLTNCGHTCEELCHPINAKPESHMCVKMCPEKCREQHPCSERCHGFTKCPKCRFPVTKILPRCGHGQVTECGIDVHEIICQHRCERVLQCGHSCMLICGWRCKLKLCQVSVKQILPCGHERIVACYKQSSKCTDPCKKQLSCEHPCPLKCTEDCRNAMCKVMVEVCLPCRHTKKVQCQYKHNPGECIERCAKLLDCEHKCPGLCREDCTKMKCEVPTSKELQCGHSQLVPCGDHGNVTCTAQCEKVCSKGHLCGKRCHAGSDCPPCKAKTSFKIPICGHMSNVPCHVDTSTLVCQKPCEEKRPCGHKCQGKCGSPCEAHPCKKMMNRTLNCKHKIRLPCNSDPKKHLCEKMVMKNLSCKHQMMAKCHLKETEIPCETFVPSSLPCSRHGGMIKCQDATITSRNILAVKYPCSSIVEKTLPCHHTKKMRCCDSPDTANCTERCPAKLECGHPCTGECSDCRIRGYHKLCTFLCRRKLICCHSCTAACGVPCPPCDKPCAKRCPHGEYRGRCSVTYDPCPFPCEWTCLHHECKRLCKEMCNRPACDKPCQKKLHCGHPCIGLCGEDCPSLCRFCDAPKLSTIHPHYQKQSTRFIQLMDCDHIIEVQRMDNWMYQPQNQVHLKQCPICRTPIRWCFRYGNIIRQSLRDVQKVFREAHNDTFQLQADIREITKETRQLPQLVQFPEEVRHIVQPVNRGRSGTHARNRNIAPANLVPLNCLKNNLEIIRWISKTFEALKARDATSEQMLGPSEQREAAMIVEHSTNALKSIERSLSRPMIDLGMLSQQHNYVVKFLLGIHLVDCWCNAARQGPTLSPTNAANLHEQKRRLAIYVSGRPDAIDRAELHKVVNCIRNELGKAPLPTPQPVDLMNFAGFSSNSWLKCEEGHVYALRRIVRDGDVIEERDCRRCEMGLN